MMKRKRAHDEKLILKFDRKDQQLPNIHGDSDDETKTLEVSTPTDLDGRKAMPSSCRLMT